MCIRFHSYQLAFALPLILCLVFPATAFAADPWTKLSGSMQPYADVEEFEISPDSATVVYTADAHSDELFNLYSVPVGGGDPFRLSNLKTSGSQPERVEFYRISPDSTRVVYIGSQDEAGLLELYSVPIGGPASAVVKLNRTLPEDADVWDFQISPDSQTVVYSADQDEAGKHEIYAVPIVGPASSGIKLNGSVTADGNLYAFQISADSQTVVYRGDQETYDVAELYSVPIDGSAAPVKLNKALAAYGNVGYFEIDPASQLVVYAAGQESEDYDDLYVVPLQGPASAGEKISPVLPRGVEDFELTPDGARVVFEARHATIRMPELYSVPINGPGSQAVKLSMALQPDGFVLDYEVSPDSSRVVYRLNQQAAVQYELYSVPVGGPAASGVKLNGALAGDGDVKRFAISADSTRVIYTAEQQGSTTNELYSVPIAGPSSAGVKLNGPLTPDGKAWAFDLCPDSTQVAYLADANTLDVDELFVAPMSGPAAAAQRVSGPMAAGGSGVWDAWYSPDGQHIVYTAQQESATNMELYATGAGAPPAGGVALYLPAIVSP